VQSLWQVTVGTSVARRAGWRYRQPCRHRPARGGRRASRAGLPRARDRGDPARRRRALRSRSRPDPKNRRNEGERRRTTL